MPTARGWLAAAAGTQGPLLAVGSIDASDNYVRTDEQATLPANPTSLSQAIRSGDLLFCSGQIPLDPKSGQIVSDDITPQTQRVMDNISGVLKSEGLSLADVLKTTIFLTDLGNFQTVNEIYGSYFNSEPPARSTVQVSALPKGAKVEIEVIARATGGGIASDTSG